MSSPPAPPPSSPTRTVHHGDGLAFLQTPLPPTSALVTSLPDSSELPAFSFAEWRTWFIDTAARCCRATADDAVTIFFQTDVKRDGRWIDKSHLVSLGADAAQSHLLFHKFACRVPPGTITFGRPAHAHLLCFSRALRLTPRQSSADVLPALGHMPWSRSMGADVCAAVARFLIAHTACTTVVDPFCGVGTMLAVANAHGLSAIGVELSRKRAERARRLRV